MSVVVINIRCFGVSQHIHLASALVVVWLSRGCETKLEADVEVLDKFRN